MKSDPISEGFKKAVKKLDKAKDNINWGLPLTFDKFIIDRPNKPHQWAARAAPDFGC